MPPKSIPKTIQEKLDELKKRIERYEAAQRGEFTYRRIYVKAYEVPRHRIGAHYRIIPTSVPRRATRRIR